MTKTPKDDGTRSGRMEGPRLPRVQKSQGMTLEEAEKWLAPNLGYDPEDKESEPTEVPQAEVKNPA